MGGTRPKRAHPHGDRELCDEAVRLYTAALRNDGIGRGELTAAPCLMDMALLHPDPRDADWLRPVPPSAALAHLLLPITREIHERVRLTAVLADSLAPLMTVPSEDPNLSITVLEGLPLISSVLREASAAATSEILTAQPGGNRTKTAMEQGLRNSLTAIEQGARLRHIYQHPARYSPHLKDYMTRVPTGRLEVRTVEQTVERLIIVDREMALIPANAERTTALEIRHPALVTYLVQVYDVLWAQGTPLTEHLTSTAPDTPVTAVQRGIARLLVEGTTDEAVARKMGISVRTCRSHIAKLMQALGASSRTHLGALLVRSGLAGTQAPPPRPQDEGPAPPGSLREAPGLHTSGSDQVLSDPPDTT
ncbi:LuxR C-terminal-related transcriptional regulator [Streptomyces sp. NPDC060366]|uniref:helix-turn-helix transcriptional regulator n=1 Tax=Streptomyces sp. NPDC060366 TaxID=3347105 RepID=UPI00364AB38F